MERKKKEQIKVKKEREKERKSQKPILKQFSLKTLFKGYLFIYI